MPRDINDVYTLPAGNPVVPGTVIDTNWANSTLNDISQALTDSLDKSDPAKAREVIDAAKGSDTYTKAQVDAQVDALAALATTKSNDAAIAMAIALG